MRTDRPVGDDCLRFASRARLRDSQPWRFAIHRPGHTRKAAAQWRGVCGWAGCPV